MRREPEGPRQLYSYVDKEHRIAADYQMRAIRTLVDEALEGLSGKFSNLNPRTGCPSLPTEQMLQAFLTVRPERKLMQHINGNMPYR